MSKSAMRSCNYMKFLARGLLILFAVVPFTFGYSSGPPEFVCDSLTPSHGAQKQTSASPYEITFSPSTFTANGSPVTVTISTTSGATFKGFILTTQYTDSCVDQDLKPGTFTASSPYKISCNGAAVTHGSVNSQNMLSFQWTPPSTSQGNIRFRATFVRAKTTFWVDVKSNEELVDSNMGSGQSSCSSTVPSAGTTPGQTGTIQKDPACGTTKGCYSDCSGTDCNYLMTWVPGPSADNIRITMMGKPGNAGNNYIAFGLSNDSEMGDDSVHFCVNEVDGVFSSYNDGKSNKLLSNTKDGLSNISVAFQNGVLTCEFIRTKAGGANGQLFAFDKEYTVFWAEGPGSSGGIGIHDSIPKASSAAVSLQDFTADVTGEADDFPLIKAHGSFMIAAWILCASIGIVLARYFKNVWEDSTWFGQKIWFQVHRACMVTCLLATVIAFIIIFVEVEGYSEIQGEGYKKAHPVLGITVTILTVINPIMALFRPHPGTKNRPIFNWLHWGVGVVAYVLAVLTVFFGMKLDKAGAPDYTVYILVGFVAWMVCIQLILELTECKGRNAGASNKYEMSDMSGGHPDAKSSGQGQSTRIKPILLAIHVVVIVAFTIALMVVLNVDEHDLHDH